MIKKLTALTNLSQSLAVFWRSHKVFQILASLLTVSFIAGVTFITLKEFEKRKAKVFAATPATQVELPKGIKKENLPNLTLEQKEKLDREITSVIRTKIETEKLPEESRQVVVVLTQNGQPILPDLEKKGEETESRGEAEPPPSPTPTSISVATPTTSSRESGEAPVLPTPTPTPKPQTPTLGPADWICTDTDGGKNLYQYGVVTWGDTTWKDSCFYEGQSTDSCSGNYCRVFESYCENNPPSPISLPVREIFNCNYGGCKDGACLILTPTPTSTPTSKITPSPSPTPTQAAVAHEPGDLTFFYEGDVEQAYKTNTGRNLQQDVNDIYRTAKEIYGQPFNKISVRVKIGDDSHYNISTNEMVIGPQWFPEHLLWLILRAMHDDLFYYMPANWEEGIQNVVEKEINWKIFAPDKEGRRKVGTPFYELANQSPGWAGQDGDVSHVSYGLNPGYSALEAIAFYKIYFKDKEFFANFNKQLYKQTIDNKLKDKVIDVARQVAPVIEGMFFSDWVQSQFILHLAAHPGKYLIPFLQKSLEQGKMEFSSVVTQISQNGSRTTPEGVTVGLRALSTDNALLWGKSVNSGPYGEASFGELPYFGEKFNFIRNYTGAVKFEVGSSGYDVFTFCYPYLYSQPYVADGWSSLGVFGCVLNRKTGKVTLKADSTYEKDLDNGMFLFPEAYSFRGEVELSYSETAGATPITKKFVKDTGDYYLMLKLLGAATSQTRGLPQASPGENCSDSWEDYENEDFKLKFKIPPGWTDDSIDERQSESIIDRHLASTTKPEEQLDPQYKISSFRIIASKNDLKTDENYQGLFENYAEGAKQSQTDFKGVSAEKVVAEITQPAGDFHSEQYYFENEEVYYYLKLGIYTTPDLKEKNEAILKCFLDNFELPGQEEAVGGMKLFTSQRLQFKIRYPADLFAYEWKSSYQPDFNKEKPDWDRNVVQFFKNKDLSGGKITILRHTNTQRKTAKDFAKAYWSASEESLKHWKPGNIDFVVHSVKVQGSNEEEKTYLTPLGDWMYIFNSSETGYLQSALEKMLPTLEFLGSGEGFSEDLIPCPDDLFSTAEQLKEQQENWWEKPDPCESRPEQKICGYIRSIYDNGVIQIHNGDYRNPYCYCSFFEKNGSRVYRGTEMFSLGYEEGPCKEKI